MTFHVFKDEALTEQISEGDHSNPDDDVFDGAAGDSKDRQLFIANEQATLAVGLDETSSTILLSAPRFSDGDILILDTEQMQVVSGGGTATLTVIRGFGTTSAAAHVMGTTIYAAYDYGELTITPSDISGPSEASWIRVASSQIELDTATPGGFLNLGSKPHHTTLSFWRRITVPPNTPVQKKTDLALQYQASKHPI